MSADCFTRFPNYLGTGLGTYVKTNLDFKPSSCRSLKFLFLFSIICIVLILNNFYFCSFFFSNLGMREMDVIKDEDRVRRLQILEKKIRDPRSVSNVDSLLVNILT